MQSSVSPACSCTKPCSSGPRIRSSRALFVLYETAICGVRRRRVRLRLDEYASGVVDAPQGLADRAASQELVHRLACPLPVAIVVKLNDAAWADSVVEMLKTH